MVAEAPATGWRRGATVSVPCGQREENVRTGGKGEVKSDEGCSSTLVGWERAGPSNRKTFRQDAWRDSDSKEAASASEIQQISTLKAAMERSFHAVVPHGLASYHRHAAVLTHSGGKM